ncbi:hypothetical protein BD410DRAFT_773183 [Rickenella mellea]|uniref:Uncharacterized protein n=1 Tax=Rickenella mellea TaxID=50990 RepID=A0A4Y7PYZ8_9AGAM|nr:hypothetical protein BD410DRAFT_773183 [Rickenella mellea]
MPDAKKRKVPGLSEPDLRKVCEEVLGVKGAMDDGGAGGVSAETRRRVDELYASLMAHLGGPEVLNFSNAKVETLERLNIEQYGWLERKPDLKARITASTSLGQNKVWTSNLLYKHLLMLENQVHNKKEAASRLWIDAFLFRASAMLSPGQETIITPEHTILPIVISPESLSTLSGSLDYSAVIPRRRVAAPNFSADLQSLQRNVPFGLFVIEAKPFKSDLEPHIPQAVCQLFACAKHLNKRTIRGTLSNGRQWIFIILTLNHDSQGGSFTRSDIVDFDTKKDINGNLKIHRPWPDTIAAILSHWIERSFSEIDENDWFTDSLIDTDSRHR